jgi:hypothetical protein
VSAQSDIQASINSIAEAIAGYAAALATDSINPRESYSLDGENVSRESWRTGIAGMIRDLRTEMDELQITLNNISPYVIRTRHRL